MDRAFAAEGTKDLSTFDRQPRRAGRDSRAGESGGVSCGMGKNISPIFAPFRQAALEAPGVEAVFAQGGDGLIRVDAVRPSAVGDDLGVRIEGRNEALDLRQRRVARPRNVAGDRLRSVMSRVIRRRNGLTAEVASAMGWSPDQRLVLSNETFPSAGHSRQ